MPILLEACAVMSSSLCSQNLILVFKHGGNEVVQSLCKHFTA